MLTINIPEKELFNEVSGEFITIPKTELHLEHSLISLSRWESKWKKPFLNLENPTEEQMLDYICCMSVDKTPSVEAIKNMSVEDLQKIRDYIADKRSATEIYDRRPKKGGKREIYTSEVIYYYMIYFGIPFSCEKWHLNRLLTLIRVCGVKGGTTNQAMTMDAIFSQNSKLNAARRSAMHNGK